jgi:hypothetical protein
VRIRAPAPQLIQVLGGHLERIERGEVMVRRLLVACLLSVSCATAPGAVSIPLQKPPRSVGELVEQLHASDAPSRAAAAWAPCRRGHGGRRCDGGAHDDLGGLERART